MQGIMTWEKRKVVSTWCGKKIGSPDRDSDGDAALTSW